MNRPKKLIEAMKEKDEEERIHRDNEKICLLIKVFIDDFQYLRFSDLVNRSGLNPRDVTSIIEKNPGFFRRETSVSEEAAIYRITRSALDYYYKNESSLNKSSKGKISVIEEDNMRVLISLNKDVDTKKLEELVRPRIKDLISAIKMEFGNDVFPTITTSTLTSTPEKANEPVKDKK
jgi:hypothetical protein